MDHLELDQALLIGHDIGPVVAQTLAQKAPDRFPRLVLLNPPYPGIGARASTRGDGGFWYTIFTTCTGRRIWSHTIATRIVCTSITSTTTGLAAK